MAEPKSRAGIKALNWLNFFAADISTGVGPFLAVFLTANQHWKAGQIGIVLSAMSFSAVITQSIAGYVVGKTKYKRIPIIIATIVLGVLSFSIPFFPSFKYILCVQIIMGVASAFYMPTLIALAASLSGKGEFDGVISKNQGFNHAGNVIAAIFIGVVGKYTHNEGIFYCLLTLAVFCVISALSIPQNQIKQSALPSSENGKKEMSFKEVFKYKPLLIFLLTAFSFHLANGALLPLVGRDVSLGRSSNSSLYLSACVIVAQLVMVPVCYICGKQVHKGRKWLLIIAFTILPIRALLYTVSANPYYLISVQVLDGIAAGIFGVVSILMVADLMGESGSAIFAQGLLVTVADLGGSLSNVMSGFIVDAAGFTTAFIVLACIAAGALLLLWLAVPETLNFTEQIPETARARSQR
ncbi:MFS transporter [Mucilaginibacter koreensis]